jgi:RluA family pseudouridine synthase
VSRPAPEPPLLYRDPHFLAIDKPAGLPSVRERWTDDESAFVKVWDLLKAEDAEARKPRVVHRLDKETSGVLLFATSLEAARALSRQFRDREVEKRYLAIVLGTPPEDDGTIEVRIDEVPKKPGRMRVVAKKGRETVTDWTVLERFRGYALLEVRPKTGRTHQIRVCLQHLGYPLLVDPAYGGGEGFFLSQVKRKYKAKKDRPELPLIGRVSLHAAGIALPHPVTGEPVRIEAEPPKDFELALKYLRRFRELAPRRSG